MAKEYRKYKKLVRKFRKKIIKQVKTSVPFDYEDTLDVLILFLTFMRDYYQEENFVSDIEFVESLSRLEILNNILNEYYSYLKYKNMSVNDFIMIHKNEYNSDEMKVSIENDYLFFHKKKTHTAEMHWNKFWNMIRDEIRNLWD